MLEVGQGPRITAEFVSIHFHLSAAFQTKAQYVWKP